MPIDDQTKRKIAASVGEREALTESSARIRGLVRVDIEATDGVHAIARNGGHEMHIDEPEERGGTNQGASPLAHFLAGIGTWTLTHYVRVTFEEDLPIKFQTVNVRGENNRGPGGGFETISQEIVAEGAISPQQLEHLVERAQSVCFTHNTLKYGVKLVTTIKLNGEEALRKVSEPTAR